MPGKFKEVRITDGLYDAGVDPSGHLVTMDLGHHYVHVEKAFYVKSSITLASDATVDVRLVAPNTAIRVHVYPTFDTTAETQYIIYEGVTLEAAGTTVTPLNRDRNSTSVATTAVSAIENASVALANADTGIGAATIIFQGVTGSGRKIGGGATPFEGHILKQNTIYSFRLVANAESTCDYILNWYEK